MFRREFRGCAEAAAAISNEHDPGEALAVWLQRYAEFIQAKRGLRVAA
ncbi:hypothetical protein [Parvularcula dongshanensis]|uniref:Uncharacterized protein n=1 Tax=Parvularcula dongshanensis TaxID=1173995 RepID=A0A840I6R9_9PROT|nr:hypothetical protein [Parvularcula dongshanensis]MBB4660005.1 hypothetical protein [Parvularcula dongshanensis]